MEHVFLLLWLFEQQVKSWVIQKIIVLTLKLYSLLVFFIFVLWASASEMLVSLSLHEYFAFEKVYNGSVRMAYCYLFSSIARIPEWGEDTFDIFWWKSLDEQNKRCRVNLQLFELLSLLPTSPHYCSAVLHKFHYRSQLWIGGPPPTHGHANVFSAYSICCCVLSSFALQCVKPKSVKILQILTDFETP